MGLVHERDWRGCMPADAVSAETGWRSPRVLAPLLRMGQRSYEIYLTHMFVVIVLAQAFIATRKATWAVPLFFVGVVIMSTLLGELVAVVEKSGETEWKQVEPTRGATKDGRMANVLLALKALKWKDIASKGGDEAKYGLDKPELEMSVFKADGSEVGTLLVGKTDGAVTYVKVKAEPGIYAVSSKDLDDLRKARTDVPA